MANDRNIKKKSIQILYTVYDKANFSQWKLSAPQTEVQINEAISNFKVRCATAVPAVYVKRIEALGL